MQLYNEVQQGHLRPDQIQVLYVKSPSGFVSQIKYVSIVLWGCSHVDYRHNFDDILILPSFCVDSLFSETYLHMKKVGLPLDLGIIWTHPLLTFLASLFP